jgi:transcriptional regulator with XRE-family HTH domain
MSSPESKGKKALPARELEICRRFKLAREARRVSQYDLAQRLEVTRSRISSYEFELAPVPCEFALRACRELRISEEWLATGVTPIGPALGLSLLKYHGKVKARARFSEVYDSFLAADVERLRIKYKNASDEKLMRYFEAAVEDDKYRGYDRQLAEKTHADVPDGSWKAFYVGFSHYVDKFFFDLFSPPTKAPATEKEKGGGVGKAASIKQGLTSDSASVTDAGMGSSLLDVLMDRLRVVTKPRGAKAALAREFGVTPQAVHEWLKRRSAPSAESCLKLLDWVSRAEGNQNKSSAAVSPATEPKARKKEPLHGNQNQGRRRKVSAKRPKNTR